MKHFIPIFLVLLLAKVQASAGQENDGKLVEVLSEYDCSRDEFMDKAFNEYSDYLPMNKVEKQARLLKRHGNDIHIAAISYTATDPDGNEYIASGIVAYPIGRKWKGTVEIVPGMKSRAEAASKIMVSVELIPALFGCVTIIPDMTGFGASEQYPIDYMGFRRSVGCSAAIRRAADQYVEMHSGIRPPASTIIMGYSLGAGGAFALAKHYQENPEEGVQVSDVYCGGGAYDPGEGMKALIENGKMEYMLAPHILISCDWYNHLGVDFSNIFTGELFENYRTECDGSIHPYGLAKKYGTDLTAYLHPDFFKEEMNGDILKLYDALCQESVCQEWAPLFNLHIFHSAADDIVPVECSDALFRVLQKTRGHKLKYHRTKSGTHYDIALNTYVALMKRIIF